MAKYNIILFTVENFLWVAL